MKKFLKKLILWTSIVIGAMLLIAIILAGTMGKQIGRQIVKEINKQLETELTVQDVSVSLVRTFPNASADLREVVLEDAFGGQLLEAKKLAFRIGLFSLLGSNIKVKSVLLKDGKLNIINTDGSGKANYDIFKASESETESESEFGFSLDKATLENVTLTYLDKKERQHIKLQIKDLEASGNFSSQKFSLKSNAKTVAQYLEMEGERYLSNKPLNYDAKIDVDLEAGTYKLDNVEIGLGANVVKAEGWVESHDDYMDMDIKLKNKNGNLAAVFSLLPEKYLDNLQGIRSKGNFLFDAAIKGRMDKKTMPGINVNFGMKDGQISMKGFGETMKDISFDASFTNGKDHTGRSSVFELKKFKGYFDRELLEMDLKIRNLDDMHIDFQMDGVLPLNVVPSFINNDAITKGSGEVEFKNIDIKGRYKDMTRTSRAGSVDASGEIEFDDAELTVNNEKLTLDKGILRLANNSLFAEDVKVEAPGTELNFEGTFLNLLPVLFSGEDNPQHAELRFNAKLNAPKLDIDKLMAFGELPFDEKRVEPEVLDSLRTKKTVNRERRTNLLKGTFEADIASFNYREIEGANFKGKLEFDNNELIIKGNTDAMGGTLNVDATGHFEKEPYARARITCQDVDVKEFFRQTENFSQDILTDKNLSGKLQANIFVETFWDTEGNFLMDDLKALADLRIENGELKDFEMLYEFSNVLKLKDLRQIRFTTLQTWMEIKDSRMYLPVTFIQSSVMNLTINGEHSFNNEMDYNIKVNAGQVLAGKLKKHNPLLEPIKAKKRGFLNLYYNINGTVDAYRVRSDKKAIKEDFYASEKRKEEIKWELVRVFGPGINLDEPEDWRDIPEYEEEGDPRDTDYLEWEEEGKEGKNGENE